jgi:hypothetical protein
VSSSKERAKSCEKPVLLLDCLDNTPPEEPPVPERQNPSFRRPPCVAKVVDDDCNDDDGEKTPLLHPGSCKRVVLMFEVDELVRNRAIREISAAALEVLAALEDAAGSGEGGSSESSEAARAGAVGTRTAGAPIA